MPLDNDLTEFTTAAPFIVTFDSKDISSGTGIEVFNLANTQEQTTASFFLSDNTIFSSDEEISTSVPTSTDPFAKIADIDFDTSEQQFTRDLEGTMIVNYIAELSKPSGFVCQVFIITKLRKFDGTTETEIANVQSETIDAASGGTEKVLSSQLIVPLTSISVGDKIRVTVEIWGKNTDSGNAGTFLLGSDPANRSGTNSIGTKSSVYIPFKLVL